jgi:hypothetical protein
LPIAATVPRMLGSTGLLPRMMRIAEDLPVSYAAH